MLDSKSSVSLYEQLQVLVKDDILRGVYQAGAQMPSEMELCEAYKVSRVTVRRALKELASEGFLEIIHGKGTFVKKPAVDVKVLEMGGFSEIARRHHYQIEKRILKKQIVAGSDATCEALGLKRGAEVLRVKRLILESGAPLSIDDAFFPLHSYPGISEKIVDGVSLFKLIREDYNLVMDTAYKEFGVTVAPLAVAQLLECSVGEPLFSVKKTIYDPSGQPIHFSTYCTIASRIKYSLTVNRDCI